MKAREIIKFLLKNNLHEDILHHLNSPFMETSSIESHPQKRSCKLHNHHLEIHKLRREHHVIELHSFVGELVGGPHF